jgi:hypothetical protein
VLFANGGGFVCVRVVGERVLGGCSWEVVLRRICGGGLHYMRLISTRYGWDLGLL